MLRIMYEMLLSIFDLCYSLICERSKSARQKARIHTRIEPPPCRPSAKSGASEPRERTKKRMPTDNG